MLKSWFLHPHNLGTFPSKTQKLTPRIAYKTDQSSHKKLFFGTEF